MHKLCEYIDDELKELEKKIGNGHELNEKELEYGDLLAHFKKSLLTNEAMEDSGYSGDTYRSHYRGRMDGGEMSYARGRTGNVRRDSMGRYSRNNPYSYAEAKDEMMTELREIMKGAPDEDTKREFKSFISRLETM